MTKRRHISPSALALFEKCGEAYRRSYDPPDGRNPEKIPPGSAALRGSGVHTAAEANHRQKVESRIDLPRADIVDLAAEGFESRLRSDGVQLTPEEQERGARRVLGEAKDLAVRVAALYAERVAPKIQPAAGWVERRVRVTLPGEDVDLVGVIDVATEGGRVKDLKTRAAEPNQAAADQSTQLTWYALAYFAVEGAWPAGLDLDVLVAKKTPDFVSLATTRSRRDLEVLFARIRTMQRAVKAGIYTPAPEGAWWCSERWCGYWATCPYVNAKRKGG